MTIRPPTDQFTAGGHVRVADVLTSIAKEIDRVILETYHQSAEQARRPDKLRALAIRVRRLAETIEKGGA